MTNLNFPSKWLKCLLVILSRITRTGTKSVKFNEENSCLEQNLALHWIYPTEKNPTLNFWSKLWLVRKIYTITEYIWKTIEKRMYNFLLSKNNTTFQAPNAPSHLEVWVLYFRHRYSIKFLKIKWIQHLLNSTNALRRDLMLYWLDLVLISNHGFALFRHENL